MAGRYRFFQPRTGAQLRQLELTVRGVVEGVYAGLHKSPHRGFSIEFAEHREYVPGDEIKHLDWTVLARSDRYYIKQYEQETNLRATICLDASGSMGYGGKHKTLKTKDERQKTKTDTLAVGSVTKFEYAAVLAASLAFVLSNQQDMVGLSIFDTQPRLEIPAGNGPAHLDQIFRKLETIRPGRETNVSQTLFRLAARIPRRGLVILISDLLDDPDQIMLALQRLKHARHQMIVIQVLDPAELDVVAAAGGGGRPVTFEDMETNAKLAIDPRQIREDYRREMEAFLEMLKRRCGEFRMDYVRVTTDMPWEAAVREIVRTVSR